MFCEVESVKLFTMGSRPMIPRSPLNRLIEYVNGNLSDIRTGGNVMKSSFVTSAVISLCVLLLGCAGTRFVRVSDDILALGQTTYEEVTARLGLPYQEGVIIKNNQQIKTISYAYASTVGEGDAKGVVAARSQGFYFFDNKLVGYTFTSSWKENSTDFDSGKVSQINKGESTRNDVVLLLGNPGGKYIYPLIPVKDEEALNYLYVQTKDTGLKLKLYQKQLVVTFNKQGIVTNVEFTEAGQQ
jgi:hypothetical protein